MNEPSPRPPDDDEAPAPLLAKLALTLAPFVVAALVWWLLARFT